MRPAGEGGPRGLEVSALEGPGFKLAPYRLEIQAKCQHDVPRTMRDAEDTTEGRQTIIDIGVRIADSCAVEYVEEAGPELEIDPFTYSRGFYNTEVFADMTRPAHIWQEPWCRP